MKYIVLLSVLLLAACQNEKACYDKNNAALSDSAILAGEGLLLYEIHYNEDLNSCDYTVLGGRVYKK
jgi:hypothetical protein